VDATLITQTIYSDATDGASENDKNNAAKTAITMLPMMTLMMLPMILVLTLQQLLNQSNPDQLDDQPVCVPPDPPDDTLPSADQQPCAIPTDPFALSNIPILMANLAHKNLATLNKTQSHHQPTLPAKLQNI